VPLVTIFGTAWGDLDLEHVQTYLDQADDEPLLWEAKGTKLDKNEVRRQVCAFANGHEVGYLILGAERAVGASPERRWVLDGVSFPDEPMTWITNIVTDLATGVRPRPDFDVKPWAAPNGHVAVVRVTPTSTPPCIANGTVYERLPGKTQTVRDPLILAGLFSRGDEAQRNAQARADRAALIVMNEWLQGDAGVFRVEWVTPQPEADEEPGDEGADDVDAEDVEDVEHVRFSIGVAATGNPPNISGRLFRDEFATDIWNELRERPAGLPAGYYASSPDPVTWSQEALTWRHQVGGNVNAVTVVRAVWDGSVCVGQKLSTDDVYPDSFAQTRVSAEWQLADRLVQRLGGFGDVYVTVLFAGGRFPRRKQKDFVVMRRGPLLPGVDDEHVASLGRELMRAVGNADPEP
jgi:hypothetical protein